MVQYSVNFIKEQLVLIRMYFGNVFKTVAGITSDTRLYLENEYMSES